MKAIVSEETPRGTKVEDVDLDVIGIPRRLRPLYEGVRSSVPIAQLAKNLGIKPSVIVEKLTILNATEPRIWYQNWVKSYTEQYRDDGFMFEDRCLEQFYNALKSGLRRVGYKMKMRDMQVFPYGMAISLVNDCVPRRNFYNPDQKRDFQQHMEQAIKLTDNLAILPAMRVSCRSNRVRIHFNPEKMSGEYETMASSLVRSYASFLNDEMNFYNACDIAARMNRNK